MAGFFDIFALDGVCSEPFSDVTYTAERTSGLRVYELHREIWDAVPGARLHGLLREANRALRTIARSSWWSYLRGVAECDLIASYDTGTVAVTSGSTTVTVTDGVFSADMVNRRFKVDGDDTFYQITAVSDPTLTLERAYEGDTDAEADYSIYQDTYSLPANFERMAPNGLSSLTDRSVLKPITYQEYVDLYMAREGFLTAGHEKRFYLSGLDQSLKHQIKVCWDGAGERLRLIYQRRVVEAADPEDYVDMPPDPEWEDCLLDRLKYHYLLHQAEPNQALAVSYLTSHETRLKKLKAREAARVPVAIYNRPMMFKR